MKFVAKNTSGENIINLVRRVGYHYQGENKEKSELIFVRPLERSGYPRFHLYLKVGEKTNELIFNLHLDQKKPIYKGAPAHAGEYEGKVVETEAERIKQILQKIIWENNGIKYLNNEGNISPNRKKIYQDL